MDKNYVLEGAEISCEYGEKFCFLKIPPHRHITETSKFLANETDISNLCITGFGQCRSGYFVSSTSEIPDLATSIHQMGIIGGGQKCTPKIILPWQNAKEDVRIGSYKALLENSWTFCSKGYGFLSFVTSGQDGELILQLTLEKLKELLSETDQYLGSKQISDKYRDGLLESILLWNGYQSESLAWDYKSSDMNNEFCKYLAEKNPSLFNFFERKLVVRAKDGESVDLGYMMGIYMDLEKNRFTLNAKESLINEEMVSNDAMFNAYLEACRQKEHQTFYEMLKKYLNNEAQGKNTESRYETYVTDKTNGIFCDWQKEENSHRENKNLFKGPFEKAKNQLEERSRTREGNQFESLFNNSNAEVTDQFRDLLLDAQRQVEKSGTIIIHKKSRNEEEEEYIRNLLNFQVSKRKKVEKDLIQNNFEIFENEDNYPLVDHFIEKLHKKRGKEYE